MNARVRDHVSLTVAAVGASDCGAGPATNSTAGNLSIDWAGCSARRARSARSRRWRWDAIGRIDALSNIERSINGHWQGSIGKYVLCSRV